jgi:hypothetical protein
VPGRGDSGRAVSGWAASDCSESGEPARGRETSRALIAAESVIFIPVMP